MMVDFSRNVEAAAVTGINAIGDTTANLSERATSLAEDIYQKHMDMAQAVVDGVVDTATVTIPEILNRLPLESAADMPPEVQSLIEVRGAEDKLTSCFAELREQGGLDEVIRYLDQQRDIEEKRTVPQALPDLDPGERPETKFTLPKLG